MNHGLSLARANTVYQFLVEQGINPKRLSTRGWGRSKPIADNKTDEGRAQNRRVEFLIKKIKPLN